MSKTIQIFISYSHQDEKYKDELLKHLRILERQGAVHLWDNSDIQSAGEWNDGIKKAIDESKIAILLISSNFLASDYIVQVEFPALLKRAKSNDIFILPILLSPSLWTEVPELAQFQFLNDVRTPLSQAKNKEEEYFKISKRITDLVLANQEKEETEIIPNINDPQRIHKAYQQEKGQVFVSYCRNDGDFAELLKLKLEKEGIQTWVDNDGIDPGEDWRQDIDDAIRKSVTLIVIMSPEARESEYVTYEWAFAWGVNIQIIPIMLKQTSLHPRLAILQYLDFTNRITRPWDRLIKSIKKNFDS
ncbi:MAG: toll/interleukin-1 receptor domain-containing protein [Agriterribacter sp.]